MCVTIHENRPKPKLSRYLLLLRSTVRQPLYDEVILKYLATVLLSNTVVVLDYCNTTVAAAEGKDPSCSLSLLSRYCIK